MIRRTVSVAIVFVILGNLTAQSQDWSEYKATTVAAAWSRARTIKGIDYTIAMDNIKYVVEAVYTGEHREIGPKRRELIKQWAEALRQPRQVVEQDIQVRAGTQTVWVPLQNVLLKPFTQEAKAGSRLRLYVMYVGAAGEDRVFIVNRFQVLPR